MPSLAGSRKHDVNPRNSQPAPRPRAHLLPWHARGHGRQRRSRRDGNRRRRGCRRLSDHAVHADGRGMGAGRRRRQAQRQRPPAALLRARGRARRRRGDGRHVDVRAARDQLLERAGHRLHARVALRGGGQAADLRAQHRRARDDQARAERARRPRRLSRGRRHRLLPALRQGRAGGRRPQPDRAPHRRAVAQPRHLRPGRLPHAATSSSRSCSPSATWSRPISATRPT